MSEVYVDCTVRGLISKVEYFFLLEAFDRVSHRQVSKVKYLYVELVKGIVRGRVSHEEPLPLQQFHLWIGKLRASRTIRTIGQSARQPNESLQCLESIQLW